MIGLLIHILIDLLIAGVILYIASIIINAIPALAPFKQVAMAILALIAILILASMFLPLLGDLGSGPALTTHSRY